MADTDIQPGAAPAASETPAPGAPARETPARDAPAGGQEAPSDGDAIGVRWGDEGGQDAAAAGIPEGPDGYELAIPDGLSIPDGLELHVDDSSPLASAAREYAHQAGLSQDQFNGLVRLYAEHRVAELNQLRGLTESERGKLGDKAQDRIRAVETGLRSRLGHEKAQAITAMLFTSAQVTALEALLGPRAPGASNGGRVSGGVPGWDTMSATQKFASVHERAERERQRGGPRGR